MQIQHADMRLTVKGDIELLLTVKGDKSIIGELVAKANEKPYGVEIEPLRKPKSINANSYMWVICDKIAKKIQKNTKEDIYRHAIREVGVWDDVPRLTDKVQEHIETWNSIGIGWFSEEMRFSKLNGYTVVRDYYGSSVYNSKQMSVLIDYIVDQAKEVGGIETMTPVELERMKGEWKK